MHQNVSGSRPVSTAPYSGQAPPYYVEHDADATATLTTKLVHALSDVTGADATGVEDALAEHLDFDALERLFRTGSAANLQGSFTFTLWGHQVTVYGGGSIVITPPPSRTAGPRQATGPNQPARYR